MRIVTMPSELLRPGLLHFAPGIDTQLILTEAALLRAAIHHDKTSKRHCLLQKLATECP